MLWLTGSKRRVGYGFYGGRVFLTDDVIPDLNEVHYSQRWLRLLEHLGNQVSVQQPRLTLSSAEQRFAGEYLKSHGIQDSEVLVGVHAGARVRTRQWGADNFRAVAEQLAAQYPVRIIWFEEPRSASQSDIPGQFITASLPLRQFAAVLARCRLVVCNDSGPMHVCGTLGVPVVAVFGPNYPEWFGPVGSDSLAVMHEGFWCRPCGDHCIFDQPYCMRAVSVRDVLNALASQLSAILSAPRVQEASE